MKHKRYFRRNQKPHLDGHESDNSTEEDTHKSSGRRLISSQDKWESKQDDPLNEIKLETLNEVHREKLRSIIQR